MIKVDYKIGNGNISEVDGIESKLVRYEDFVKHSKLNVPEDEKNVEEEQKENGGCRKKNVSGRRSEKTRGWRDDVISSKHKKCEDCSKMVLRKNYTLHLKVHSLVKPHMCDICGCCFKFKAALEGHRRTHTGEKPYLCNTCGRGFTTSSRLSQHVSVHTGARPHACDSCPRAFRTKKDLQRHVRSHTGEKPYTCAFCGKGFAQSWNLREHTRRHTGELPHVCHVCHAGFLRNNLLTEHLRRIHDEKSLKASQTDGCDVKWISGKGSSMDSMGLRLIDETVPEVKVKPEILT